MSSVPSKSPLNLPWQLVAMLMAGVAFVALYFILPPAKQGNPDSTKTVSENDSATPLPPLTTSPYLNTRTDVAYVGDTACAGCHPDQTRDYRQHPMGRSMFAASDFPPLEKYDHASNPFTAGAYQFQVLRRGNRLVHREWCTDLQGSTVAEQETEIAYVVGSGRQARSYLAARDGFLYQSPITWHESAQKWGLSPGYEKTQHHFSRRIDPRCVYCHSDRPQPIAHTTNRYRDPPFAQLTIGCERCHGPGELHLKNRVDGLAADDLDLTIVNPRRLTPALRENVCEQCHLQGETIVVRRGRSQLDYRPGLPLHEYMSVFVRAPEITDAGKIVTHFEQMHLSACYQKSGGQFSCTSCHDPHRMPAESKKEPFYRQQCLNCHEVNGGKAKVTTTVCSLPLAERTRGEQRDNCVTCHMPRIASSNAEHMAITDHRVPKKPLRAATPPGPPVSSEIPIVHFHRKVLPPDDEALGRDYGIALAELAAPGTDATRRLLAKHSLVPLKKAIAFAPDDVPALEAYGMALQMNGNHADALSALTKAITRVPERETSLAWAANAAADAGQLDLAVDYADRLAKLYAHTAEHHQRLAIMRIRRSDWPAALVAAENAIRIDPFHAESRSVLISVLLAMGHRARAQREFVILGSVNPAHQRQIREWFESRLREVR